MTQPRPLPSGVYQRALDAHLDMERQRVEECYARTRAVFAESVVAALLPGSRVVKNPSAAWDISWKPRGAPEPIRIQVKCSGSWVPRYKDRLTDISANWEFRAPTRGWDDDFAELGPGHHCDVFVFARHAGRGDITAGWSFYVVPLTEVENSAISKASLAQLLNLGAIECTPRQLARAVRDAAGS